MTRYLTFSYAAICPLAILLATFGNPARAGDLLIFPSITSIHQSEHDKEFGSRTFVPAVDFFYNGDFGQTRVLAEFLKSSRENELERFEVGWRILPGKTLWVGRFHNMLSFWNTQMHHGDFLQSSLSRPTVANYEDEHGPLPTHISGLMIESSRTLADSEINYMAGAGIGPVFDNVQKLEPLDLLNPNGSGKLAASFRFGYHPDAGNPNQFGAAIGYAKIPFSNAVIDPVSKASVSEAQQTVVSTFFNLEKNSFHLMGEVFFFRNRVSGVGNSSQYNTISAYVQPEYKVGDSGRTTLYARLEATPRAAYDGYLSLLPEFSPHQGLVGMRYYLTARQAVKLEAARTTRQDSLEFNSISAQWCMVLPL